VTKRKSDNGLRGLFKSWLPDIHWQAIESGGVGAGIPDSNGCFDGVEFWIEYKATSAWAVGLSAEQVGWIHKRSRAGGRVWVAVRKQHDAGPRRGEATDELWLVPGLYVRELCDRGLLLPSHCVAGRWFDGPGNWAWGSVLNRLREHPNNFGQPPLL